MDVLIRRLSDKERALGHSNEHLGQVLSGFRQVTHPDWLKEGERLYGADRRRWRFRCPLCGESASALDLYPYRDKVEPKDAMYVCLSSIRGDSPCCEVSFLERPVAVLDPTTLQGIAVVFEWADKS